MTSCSLGAFQFPALGICRLTVGDIINGYKHIGVNFVDMTGIKSIQAPSFYAVIFSNHTAWCPIVTYLTTDHTHKRLLNTTFSLQDDIVKNPYPLM